MITKVKPLLIKEPFKRVIPKGIYGCEPIVSDNPLSISSESQRPLYTIIPQSDFLRELYPSGHKINDPFWYPDKTTYVDSDAVKQANNGKGAWVTEKVSRSSVPFQFIILLKHLVHAGGNPLTIMSSNRVQTQEQKDTLAELRQGWIDKNMEVAKWQSLKGAMATGDVACVFYLDNGKIGYRTFSYLNGSVLYPHYDSKGKLVRFARTFKRSSEDGTTVEHYVEAWDDTYAYLFKKDVSNTAAKVKNSIMKLFGLDGYSLVESPKRHGFKRVPVAYKRLVGPVWFNVQDTIDEYELSLSQLCESNKVYAFPILYMIGEGADVEVSTNGRPFAITSTDPDAKIGILNNNSGTEGFKLQLESQYKHIMMGSFVVTPPEVRSGDLPGVAIKLIFSPALEKAMDDCLEWNPFFDDMFELFTYGYGIEKGRSSDFTQINAHAKQEPYIHQNIAETINLLAQSVLSNTLSVETAIEKNPFSMTDEQKRVMQEQINKAMITPPLEDGMNAYNIAKQNNN